MTRRIAAILAAAAIVATVAGCSNSTGPDEDDLSYSTRETRQGVIDRIEEGYSAADADVYLSCLAEDFLFFLESSTVGGDPTLPTYWGKQSEQEIHEAAFGGRGQVESVTLELEQERDPLEIPGPAPGDPSEWEYYQRYTINTVVDGLTYQVNGYASFLLAAVAGDTNAQGGRLWSVAEWRDTGDVPCRPDVTNWTEVKLLFSEGAGSYPLRTSPENAVEKLRRAYERMDALAFVDCLGDSFRFWPNPDDVNDPGNGIPEWWNLGTESTIAWNMFGPDTNIDVVSLTLTQLGDAEQIQDPGGGEPGWEYTYSVDLYVYLPWQLTYWANSPSRFQVFPDSDDTGPSGEELWEITKWEDIDMSGLATLGRADVGGRLEESATWGSIKALYR